MKLGFIGCGNMARAIATGIIKSELFSTAEMIATDISSDAQNTFSALTSIPTTNDINVVLKSDFIILAIKPQQFADFLSSNAMRVGTSSVIISIAAGKKIQWISSYFKENQPIVRIMPNLNATIGQAVSATTKNQFVSPKQFDIVTQIITSFGTMQLLEEKQFSTFTAIAGSSPAYFFKMIEAMSSSAAKHGIDYAVAKKIIIDTMIGSATFAHTTETELPTLIQNVTSPKGTTEAALNVFQNAKFDQIIDDAQNACIQRDIELSAEYQTAKTTQ